MRYQGSYPAQVFIDQEAGPSDRARFLALSRQLGNAGAILNHNHGHFLKAPYQDIFELKPPGIRVFGFFYETNFYLTNAAPKRKTKAQESDYMVAGNLRADFLQRIERIKPMRGR